MVNEEWRSAEVIKLLRQCVVCPACGVLVATQAGVDSHINWHNAVNTKVDSIDQQFQAIDTYVRGPNGLEAQITTAFSNTNGSITQLRADAKAYTDAVRSDATTAIVALQNRVTGLETAVRALQLK